MNDELIPDDEQEYEQRREELISDAKETKHELEAKQSEMLEAVASGDDGIDVEDYATVQVGEVEVRAKAYMPGESLSTIKRAQRLAKRENLEAALDSINTMTDAMTVVTERLDHAPSGTVIESNEEIRTFWKGMFQEWGVNGFQQAAEKVLEPASEDLESKAESAESFRGH
jgi:hypothetical protein